jgi:integrase
MSISNNITKRAGTSNYSARIFVPRDLQERLGTPGKPRKEIWKSLGTSDPREAKRRVRPLQDEWDRRFEEMRVTRHLSESELQDAVWKRYRELILADEKFRQSIPTEAQLGEVWKHLEKEFGEHDITAYRVFELIRDEFVTAQKDRIARFAKLKADTARGETQLVADVLSRIIDERRLNVLTDSPEYRKLAQGMQRAELEALQRSAERDKADWTGAPKDPLVQPPINVKRPGETVMELYDRFRKEKPGLTSVDTWNQNRKIVALFDDFAGGNVHISELTRKNVRDWKAKLFSWPIKATESSVFAGMPFLKVIEANAVEGKPTISGKTINRYLSAIGSFATWLLANDFIAEDVMRGMYLDIDRSEKTKFPFTGKQLNAIFASPLFASCAGDKQEHLPGEAEIRDWRYWIPWIALYTGARLGEIAQLMVSDVRQLHGTWIFHVTKEGPAKKSVKTAGSERVVPMHPKLIELGFLKYHARMQARGEGRLFPEIKPDARGYMSGTPSSFLNDYLRDIGVKIDKSVSMNSFRHTIADAFRAAGYLDEQFNVLFGHVKGTTTGKYGIMPEGPLADRVKMIEAVRYPTI